MERALQLHPEQQALTPAQEAEVARFAAERIQTQLATSPVDESAAEALLKHAYEVVGLSPPSAIQCVDVPLELVTILAPLSIGQGFGDTWTSVRERIRDSIVDNVEATIATSVTAPLDDSVKERVLERVIASVQEHVWEH